MLDKAKILKVTEERLNKELENSQGLLDGVKFYHNNDLVYGASIIALRVLIEVFMDEVNNVLNNELKEMHDRFNKDIERVAEVLKAYNETR